MGIMLTQGFRDMELGKDHLVFVKKVKWDEEFDTLRLTFSDEDGATLSENFFFIDSHGNPNEVALGIFSNIAKAATHDERNREIDPNDLLGLSLIADVYEQEGRDKNGKPNGKFYRHLRNFKPSDVQIEIDDEELDDAEVEDDAEDNEDDLFD